HDPNGSRYLEPRPRLSRIRRRTGFGRSELTTQCPKVGNDPRGRHQAGIIPPCVFTTPESCCARLRQPEQHMSIETVERTNITPYPDERGRYGRFGGQYAPETLMPALEELEAAWEDARHDVAYLAEIRRLARDYVGRPTPLYEAERLAAEAGGARIFLKREDLAHTGAHKINNAIGQGLLAKRMG